MTGPIRSVGVVRSFDDLVVRRAQLPGRVALCHGCFDVLHVGHVRHLYAARRLVDVLLVTVTADVNVGKGPSRPVFPESVRAEVVASVRPVDAVAISPWPTAAPLLRQLRPDVFVKGSEYRDAPLGAHPHFDVERATADELGIEVAFTDELTFSSTAILDGRAMSAEQVR